MRLSEDTPCWLGWSGWVGDIAEDGVVVLSSDKS